MAAMADQVRAGEYGDAGHHGFRSTRQRDRGGGGKLNSGNAAAADVTVNPSTASFGAVQSLPAAQTFQVRNNSAGSMQLHLSVNPRTTDNNAAISLDQSSLMLAAGESARFTASLSGTMPGPGSYEGFIVIQGGAVTLQIPYLYMVSDGVPRGLVSLLGLNGTGLTGQEVPDGMLAFEVVDQFGLPLPNVPVSFGVVRGGGQIASADAATNVYGIATAQAIMGTTQANNTFSGTAGGRTVQFPNTAVLQPVISDNGVVNAASFLAGPGIAPGSYVSIFGSNLSLGAGGEAAPQSSGLHSQQRGRCQCQLRCSRSASQRAWPPYIREPGTGQRASAVGTDGPDFGRMKVSIENASGAVFTVPVAQYSPGIFHYDHIAAFAGQTISCTVPASGR